MANKTVLLVQNPDEQPEVSVLNKLVKDSGFPGIENASDIADVAGEIGRALDSLHELLAKREGGNWLLGDTMNFIRKTSGMKISIKVLTDYMASWSPKYLGEKTKFHDAYNASVEFPEDVRLEDELSHTDHVEVLRVINTLKREKVLQGWTTGPDVMERRRELLQEVARAKEAARQNNKNWTRAEIVGVVRASHFVDPTKQAKPKVKPKKTKPTGLRPTSGILSTYRSLWRIHGASEFVVAETSAAARQLSDAPGAIEEIGVVNLPSGVYEIRKVEKYSPAEKSEKSEAKSEQTATDVPTPPATPIELHCDPQGIL